MTTLLLPNRCLLTFEAMARFRNVTLATDELLFVTSSAVSGRVPQLAQILDTKLCDRADFSLTTDGGDCVAHEREGLAILSHVPSTQSATGRRKRRVLAPENANLTMCFGTGPDADVDVDVAYLMTDEVTSLAWPLVLREQLPPNTVEDFTARGFETENRVHAHDVKWQSEPRVILDGYKTVVFR